ncbi:MAG: replicative DNA helicase [Telluria sp.]
MTRELFSHSAEQAVLGSILKDNASLDKIAGSLQEEDFYRADHRHIYTEMRKQIMGGKRADAITVGDALKDQVDDCFPYLIQLECTVGSAANIATHAEIVRDRAMLRSLDAFGIEAQGEAHNSREPAILVYDRLALKLEQLAQSEDSGAPIRSHDLMNDYVEVLTARMEGKIKPIATGFRDVDKLLDGGFERGTLSVVAGRPGTGETAMGLALGRNIAVEGSALFLSMEMNRTQVSDRNIAALGNVPISWLRKPDESDTMNWNRVTAALGKSKTMNLFIDDKTGLNMLEIRAKARATKRRHGLDLLVIDQLSFITGGSGDNKAYDIGEHTRGCVALSKELDCAVILLAQLNRDCEKRQNRRPIMADLAMSGSIEQDAANIIFLYRDELHDPASPDKGVCEVISAKQRQGQPGTVGLRYNGTTTSFSDLEYAWVPPGERGQSSDRRGDKGGGVK